MHKVDSNAIDEAHASLGWRNLYVSREECEQIVSTYLTAAKPNAEAVAYEILRHGQRDGDPSYQDITDADRRAGFEAIPLYRAAHRAPEAEAVGKWEIDNSTPSPILTYEKCSVIQDEQAYYALRLIQADQAERDVVTDEMVERGLKAAEDEAMRLTFLERDIRDGLTFDGSFTDSFKDRFRAIHRAALTAALGGSKS